MTRQWQVKEKVQRRNALPMYSYINIRIMFTYSYIIDVMVGVAIFVVILINIVDNVLVIIIVMVVVWCRPHPVREHAQDLRPPLGTRPASPPTRQAAQPPPRGPSTNPRPLV